MGRARITEALCWAVVVTTLELLFVSVVDVPEFAAAAVLGVAAGIGATAARAATGAAFRPRAAWLRWLGHLPASVVRDTVAVFAAAARGESGSWRTIDTAGGGDDPLARARRAFMALTMSLSPSSFLVDVDPATGRGLVHDFAAPSSPSALERAVTW